MGMNEKLFHRMAEKIYELAFETPDFKPDDDDVALVFWAMGSLIEGMDHKSKYVRTAAAAISVAGGEFSGDMGYVFDERQEAFDFLLDTLVADEILERLNGDVHTAYIRK